MGLDVSRIRETIAAGKAVLGIELGSTRIKAVLVDETNAPIASGAHDWEKTVSGRTAWMQSGQDCRTATQSWQRM